MRIAPPIVLALGLFSSLFLLFPRGAPTTAHAQSVAGTTITTTHTSTTTTAAAAAAHSLYLPLIHHGGNVKCTSGIHMGNRGIGTDWPEEIFAMITGTAISKWPAAVVIQSAQLYNFTFETTPPCRVKAAQIRTPNLYHYLTAANQAGTKVVIRITPSPAIIATMQVPTKITIV